MKRLVFLVFSTLIVLSCEKENTNIDNESKDVELEFVTVSENDPNLRSIFFIDSIIGYTAGYSGDIFKTIDGGNTWIELNSNTDLPLFDIFFFNQKEGFIVGDGPILHTSDSGKTWQITTISEKLQAITFKDDSTGFIVGLNIILKTSNRGSTWEEVNLDGYAMDIEFANSYLGFISCLKGKIYRTSDGGNSWYLVNTNTDYHLYSISIVDPDIVYSAGQGTMIKSADEGENWEVMPDSPSEIYALHFVSESEGFAFGRGNYSGGDFGQNFGAFHYTFNCGQNWIRNMSIEETTLIHSVSFPTNKKGFACSDNKIIKIKILQ